MNGRSQFVATLHGAATRDSILTRALAEDLAARTVAALDGSRDALRPWLFGTVGRYAHLDDVRSLVARASELAAGAALPATPDAMIADVEDAMSAFLALRSNGPPNPPRPLDAIDARIDELILRLDLADPLTAEHSRAVATWCTHLARRLGLSDEEVIFATRSGLLHDVGKLETPIEILNAARSLSRDEWTIVRAHAARGEAIVLASDTLGHLKPAVRSHHERVDGGGYPDGLAGSAIPLVARLVAVADCFNAMIGRRPYRAPMAPSCAVNELRNNAGSQFDAEVVAAMLAIVDLEQT